MEGLAIIEGKELRHITEQITNIEQTQLAIMKKLESHFSFTEAKQYPGLYLNSGCLREV